MPSATSTALPFSPAELSYLHTSLSSIPPIRSDSRASTDFRPLSAETSVLPLTNGSAHVSFSNGNEAIVGVKLEVEKTATVSNAQPSQDGTADAESSPMNGSLKWISLSLTMPSMRDDDASLIYLEEMLREPLLHTLLPAKLVINSRYHWHIYIDVLLISPHGLSAYPLPLLSMATHLALRDTRVPRLKSEGEEDPLADDDWMASSFLYARSGSLERPPVTLLVTIINENVLFDPSHEELKVADAIVAVSIGPSGSGGDWKILATRMIDTPARDTMKGVPREGGDDTVSPAEIQGVWKPKLGGIKRSMLKAVVKLVLSGGVASDIMSGLDGFIATAQ
jgi:exosome complex component RRP42